MARLVSREKLSKKARKKLATQQRVAWALSPVTRKVESKKLYNRNKKSHARRDDSMGFCCMAAYFSAKPSLASHAANAWPIGPDTVSCLSTPISPMRHAKVSAF